MIVLKADTAMTAVFKKTINVMGQNVEWNETFVINNNTLILPGKLKSLFFSFDSRKIIGDVIEEDIKEEPRLMLDNKMLENTLNMVLYIFGKWGKIKGLTVQKNYGQLQNLINGILSEVSINAVVDEKNCRFFQDGVRITYEEVIEIILEYMKPDYLSEEDEDEDEENEDDLESKRYKDNNDINENKFKLGLWHKLVWKSEKTSFTKESVSTQERNKNRLGRGFYLSNYKCPVCKEFMYMTIYPEKKENKIETDLGTLIVTRVYTCKNCMSFYTAKPYKMLMEGDVFVMDFEEDKKAYEDYLELLGKTGDKKSNSSFNRFLNSPKNDEDNTEKNDMEKHPSFKADKNDMEKHSSLKKDENDMEEYPSFKTGENNIKKDEDDAEIIKERINNSKKDLSNIYKNIENLSDEELYDVADMIDSGYFPSKSSDKLRKHFIDELEERNIDITKHPKKQKKSAKQRNDNNIDNFNKINAAETEKTNTKTVPEKIKKVVLSANDEKEDFSSKISDFSESELEDTAEYLLNLDREDDNIKKCIEIVNSNLDKKQQKSMLQDVISVKNKPFNEMKAVYDKIREKKCRPEVKESVMAGLKNIMKERGRKELDVLMKNLPQKVPEKLYNAYKEKFDEYLDIDITDYKDELDKRRDETQQQEIQEIILKSRTKPGDRNALLQLLEKIKELHYEEHNKKIFTDKIKDNIIDIDEAEIERICPEVMDLDYEDGIECYKKISEGDFLPELKTDILARIDKRLLLIKKDECRNLVRKLKRDAGISDGSISGVILYDVDKMSNDDSDEKDSIIVHNALYEYGSGGKYEFPIFIYDSTRTDTGKKGFVFTPENIYYNSSLTSGTEKMEDIKEMYIETGLFNKGIYIKKKNGADVKLCSYVKGNKDHMNMFINKLNLFIKYLEERPDSRKLNYLAQEEHKVKCCYRCGFVYKTGNVCPKCGSTNNR